MKSKASIVSIVIALSVFIMLAYCGKQKAEWKGTIKEENGVKRYSRSLKFAFPKNHSAYQSFSLDEEGRIFVQTWERTENEEGNFYDVFNSEGKYIAKIFLKFSPKVWNGNKLYTIEEDKDGLQIIKRYKVNWNI